MYGIMEQDIDVLPGVGPAIAARLQKSGVSCVGDVLFHLPKDYVDDRISIPMRDLQEGVEARTSGQVLKLDANGYGRRKQVVITVGDEDAATLQLRFFHSPFLLRDARLTVGRKLSIRGKLEWWHGQAQMLHPEWVSPEAFHAGWRAVYASLAGLGGARIAKLIAAALNLLGSGAKSPFDDILAPRPSLVQALKRVHQADDDGPCGELMCQAFERLQLEELLTYLHLMRRMRKQAQITAEIWRDTALCETFLAALPYPLTDAQAKVWGEIREDMARGQRMHRLLQGDVGSGKTWVSALAMLLAVQHGAQAVLMAPTSVLAVQHAQTLNEIFAPTGKSVALLTGSMKAGARRELLAGLADASIDMVVGTHALISDDVIYKKLGLAIVDEQHRFGVRQRWALTERGEAVHLLAMTATPIPRSMALALYGDMDLSLMRGMPPGRKPVDTRLVGSRGKLADGMRRMLDEGGRIYWIVPRIDEDEDGVSVEQRLDALKKRFPDAGVLALHGRMKAADKAQVLSAFADGTCRLLVSTTVVEVGVNVPEARLIVIEEADRYGLAQLHQLRGRVGRDAAQGYCVLLPSNEVSVNAQQRLRHLAACHDGLELAEMDLQLRGSGDALGARQSGDMGFRLLDVSRDAALIRHWHARLPDVQPTDAMLRFWRPMAGRVD
ncbi:MAG: ATP-dependent DNA helicase RecG [Mariprofundaceae bacterium]|nr:ATP-dependent DNA helicase RecG [Mariprofundaceae bacterium]